MPAEVRLDDVKRVLAQNQILLDQGGRITDATIEPDAPPAFHGRNCEMCAEHHPPSGHRALRRGRRSIPGQVYHVTFATFNRVPWFKDYALGRPVAAALNDPNILHGGRSLAWALMPDHLHWLVELGSGIQLGEMVRRLKSKTSVALNRRLGRAGSIWQPAYYDRALRSEDDVFSVARYVVSNPIKDGCTRNLRCYPLWDAIWLDALD